MKMCSNTYLMPVLSNFGLLTPLLACLGTVNVQNPLILADFGRSYAFTSEAFIWLSKDLGFSEIFRNVSNFDDL